MSSPGSPLLLERAIAITFRDKDLLHQALTHRSAVRGARASGHNERLEFLGDAVLELVTTEYLFQYREKTEGELTSWRAALVKGEHLASIARELKLGEYLNMSRGEAASGGRDKESNLANALEALIGAIFLDQGYETARHFCDTFILVRLRSLLAQGKDKDTKSVLQERAQEKLGLTPHYQVVADAGPDHDKTFVSAVYFGDQKIAEGVGNSKQKAEQEAAKAALRKQGWK